MDLYNYLQFCKQEGIINTIKLGFENSDFVKNTPDFKDLVKRIINKLLENSRVKIGLQITSGGLQKNRHKIVQEPKTTDISYTSELGLLLSNLIGLIGFELSYSLMFLYNLYDIIKLYIDKIKNCEDYETILKYIQRINNIYKFDSNIIGLKEDFDSGLIEESYNFEITLNSEILTTKDKFFNKLISNINDNIKNDMYIDFNNTKNEYISELNNLLEYTEFGEYVIESVDTLIFNIDKEIVKKPYDGWFMKLWEIINQESNIDYPIKGVETAYEDYINNTLKLNIKTQKYITDIMRYFKEIEINTKDSVFYEETKRNKTLNIIITDKFYNSLSHIMLNFYILLAKSITDNQIFCSLFSKSTRVHFLLIFYSIVCNIKPRLYDYTDSQIAILHYILLSRNTLNESVKIIETTQTKPSKKK